jgi:beta-lactamase regulating signal transducer with metallopeptidase domain
MSLFARFDPGNAMAEQLLIVLLQTSIVIVMAALCGHTVFRRRPEARHALWLGVLIMVMVSPAIERAARQCGFALWSINLPVRGNTESHASIAHGLSRTEPQFEPTGPAAQTPSDNIGEERQIFDQTGAGNADRPRTAATLLARTSEVVHGGNRLIGGLVLLWAVGALVGFARIGVLWKRTGQLRHSTVVLDPVRHGVTLDRVRDALGVASVGPVLTSTTVHAPIAVGLLHPRVILPTELAESLASDALCDVLVHEFAHVIRRDAWVGLLQRLATAIFWPHPLVHYASGQLTRAREEICDNYVLRRGDPHRYARTLVTLTELCWPLGAMRPGLGLLGTRWTLADRVAGLIDTRRISMTRTTFRTKVAVGLSLAITTLAGWGIRFDRSTVASEINDSQVVSKLTAVDLPKDAVWSVEGVVVDEQGRPAGGAVVHAREEADPTGAKTAIDGKFTLWAGHGPMYTRELVAESDGGARIGRVQFVPARQYYTKSPVRIVLKPAKALNVHVKDAAGRPLAGASVEAFDYAYQFHATTGADGVAMLRVPADARIPGIIGLKSEAGFDYFENYRTNPPFPEFEFPPLPQEITLTLDGAQTVRVKVVDPAGRPVAGVVIRPFRPFKAGKVATIEIARGATTSAITSEQGIAVFDWLPKGAIDGRKSGAVTLFVEGPKGFIGEAVRYDPAGADELSSKLTPAARLTGAARYADGSPARDLLVIARSQARTALPRGTRTDSEGRYEFERLAPGSPYVIVVNDENWASPSLISDVLKDGQVQGGPDFVLSKGTLIQGRVTHGPGGSPATGVGVVLGEDKGPLPKELRTAEFRPSYNATRTTSTDENGHFQLRVGAGKFSLTTQGTGPDHAVAIEVRNEPEIVRDLVADDRTQRAEKFISGVVIERTPTGDRPVAGALAFRWPVRGAHRTDTEGRFMVEQTPGETTLYAYSPGKKLAGFAIVPAGAESARVLVSRTGTVSGRVVTSDGKPRAKQRLRVLVARYGDASSPRFAVWAIVTDDQGRFTLEDAPVGSMGEIEAFHETTQPMSPGFASRGARTVLPFEVHDVDPIQLPDIVLPAEARAK